MSASLLAAVRAAAAGTPSSGAGRPAGADVDEAPAGMVPTAPGNAETAEALHTWLTRFEGQILRRLPSGVDAGPFLAAVRDRLPALEGCSPASILEAVLACASFGFNPDGKEAVLTRDGSLAVFIPTYRGYVRAMTNSGAVTSIRTGLVYACDEFTYEPTRPAPEDFRHVPNLDVKRSERGEPRFAYAFAWLAGGDRSQPVILSREDAEEIRDKHSRAYQRAVAEGREDTFWHTDFWHMATKSCIRRLPKTVPTSAEMHALMAVEEAAEERRPQLEHAPDPEAAALVAEAERAAKAAEGSQDVPPARLPVKGGRGRRKGVKKQRGRRAAARGSA
ncbi:RecT family recombinase [Streptomyces canus]|uniref:RecT family recombinase n=1 Tax=Streptomyces canus TaxID=58343 RepID=UPI002E252A2E